MEEIDFVCILKVTGDFGTDPHPDPLVGGTDPRIRISTKCHGSGTLLESVFRIQPQGFMEIIEKN
jgi:hypothetical protein